MLLKRPNPYCTPKHSGMSDDECHYIGEEFISELGLLIKKYSMYYSEYDEFQKLENLYRKLKKRLEDEERTVE